MAQVLEARKIQDVLVFSWRSGLLVLNPGQAYSTLLDLSWIKKDIEWHSNFLDSRTFKFGGKSFFLVSRTFVWNLNLNLEGNLFFLVSRTFMQIWIQFWREIYFPSFQDIYTNLNLILEGKSIFPSFQDIYINLNLLLEGNLFS